jgi:uncharacterized protein YfaQ (DUF2300 family)
LLPQSLPICSCTLTSTASTLQTPFASAMKQFVAALRQVSEAAPNDNVEDKSTREEEEQAVRACDART